jgi:hypothetical protein
MADASDDVVFVVHDDLGEARMPMPRSAACMSDHARAAIELLEMEGSPPPHEVHFEGVPRSHAAALVEFMRRGRGASEAELDLLCSSVFSTEEMELNDYKAFFETLNAAHVMRVGAYFSRGAALVARLLRGTTVEEMRKVLRIENDLTPAEEAEIRSQNEWVFS